jgi:diadenosine tetraphosphate (Ap4A) HIT family hydrolase
MTTVEKMDSDNLIRILQKRILDSDSTVTGFNIGMNCGESAGQTIFHAHLHLIPRIDGDTPNPRGGVRGVIPDRINYKN